MATSIINAGTVTLAASTSVTGSGTNWLAAGVRAGDLLVHGGEVAVIASVASDTSLTLTRAWPGATGSGLAYDILGLESQTRTAENNSRLRELLAGLEKQGPSISAAQINAGDYSAIEYFFEPAFEAFFFLDASSTEADDGGVTTLVDSAGNRFTRIGAPVASVNGQTGAVVLAPSDVGAYERLNLLGDGGRFGTPVKATLLTSFVAPAYLSAYNSATIEDGGKFIFDNSTFGGAAAALTPAVEALVERQQTNPVYKRYGVEWHALKVTAGAGTAGPMVTGGVTRYLTMTTPNKLISNGWTFSFWLEVTSGSAMVMGSCIDGAKPAADNVISPADGWVHVAREHTGLIGYDGAEPRIYAEPGTVFHIAQLALLSSNGVLGDTPYLLNIAEAWQ